MIYRFLLALVLLSGVASAEFYKNTASQKVAFYAYDATDGTPKTGDSANLTAYVSIDGAAESALTDTGASEIDATNSPGVYVFDLTQGETNGALLVFTCTSSTANIQTDPVIVYTSMLAAGVNTTLIEGADATDTIDARLTNYDAPTNAEMIAATSAIEADTQDIQTQIGTAANQTTIITHLTDIKGATFSGSTDSLEAIRDRGDAAWASSVTGTGDVTITSASLDDSGDDMAFEYSGAGIAGATVRAYVASEYTANPLTATVRAIATTADDGSWGPIYLSDGVTYTLTFSKSGYSVATATVTPAA